MPFLLCSVYTVTHLLCRRPAMATMSDLDYIWTRLSFNASKCSNAEDALIKQIPINLQSSSWWSYLIFSETPWLMPNSQNQLRIPNDLLNLKPSPPVTGTVLISMPSQYPLILVWRLHQITLLKTCTHSEQPQMILDLIWFNSLHLSPFHNISHHCLPHAFCAHPLSFPGSHKVQGSSHSQQVIHTGSPLLYFPLARFPLPDFSPWLPYSQAMNPKMWSNASMQIAAIRKQMLYPPKSLKVLIIWT